METTWESTGRTIEDIVVRCRELGAAPEAGWSGMEVGKLGTTITFAEARERLVCDELMRALARPGGVIGRPTALQAYFCAMRGRCALDTLGILHAELRSRALYPRPPSWSSEELLEWLLVSNWQQRHDTWLKLSAYAMATGNTYYSG